MSSRFTPCPTCARHVKQGDGACPFCGAQAPGASTPGPSAVPTAAGRLSRSALFAASAVGVALATTDCSSASPQPLYGGVVTPVGDAAPVSDAAPGGGSGDAADAVSSPPLDAAGEAAPGRNEGGSVQPLYGAVAPPADAGSGQGGFDGSAIALYGGAPVGVRS